MKWKYSLWNDLTKEENTREHWANVNMIKANKLP